MPEHATVTGDVTHLEDRVFDWRVEQFCTLGLASYSATLMASWSIEIEAARRLSDLGCPPHLILRILRPI